MHASVLEKGQTHIPRTLLRGPLRTRRSVSTPLWLGRRLALQRNHAAVGSTPVQQEEDTNWNGPGSGQLRFEYGLLTDEEVDDLIDHAASLISVIDDVRPLDPDTFNASFEIWKALAAIPPADRARVLDELEPGAVRSLWKHSIGRYVLGPERSAELFQDYSIWDDFPDEPGQVFWYEGLSERMIVERSPGLQPMAARGGSGPISFQPVPGSVSYPRNKFKQGFWCCTRTGLLHSHLRWQVAGPISTFWTPAYNRLDVGLVLTPIQADAGADAMLVYPIGSHEGMGITAEDLPNPMWPKPRPGPVGASPFSLTAKDYIRVAGPGVFVGCGYRPSDKGDLVEDNFVYFVLAKK